MPVVKRGGAGSWGQELLQPSPSTPPPAVSQRRCSPLSFPEFQPDPGESSHPWALKGHILPTHSLEFIAALAEHSLVFIFKLA